MTKTTQVTRVESAEMDESSIIDHLKKHPDILERHPEVLKQLKFSHDSGDAISLVERQLKLLRDENKALKNKLSALVHIARENEELGQRFHRLSLELMAGEHLHDIIAMTQDQVQTFFYTDHVSFCFNDELTDQLTGLESSVLDPSARHADKIRAWMKQRKPVFGPLDTAIRRQFFGERKQINSCVLVPLYHTRDFGLLVLGSKSRDRFTSNMGTVFLSQLGELISGKIKNYLH